jgi:hypothetical protein
MSWRIAIYGNSESDVIQMIDTEDIERVREVAAAAIVLQVDFDIRAQ